MNAATKRMSCAMPVSNCQRSTGFQPAVFLGVVPGKQEVGHAACLAAIGLRYNEQTGRCRERGD